MDAEDEDKEFLAAAEEDDDLVAGILIRLSRSQTPPKPRPPSPMTEGATRPLLETRWGGQRSRSRSITMEGILAAKREEEEEAAAAAGRRASPSTPLSWSGVSGSSGSVCGDGWPAPFGPPKRRGEHGEESQGPRQEAELCSGGEQIRALQAKKLTAELRGDGGSPVRVPPPAAFFSAYWAENKALEVAEGGMEVSGMASQVESQRWASLGLGSIGFKCLGKKKQHTLAELHVLEESLSQEQEELQKELEKHKEIYDILLEENMKLKKVELPSRIVSEQPTSYISCEEAANREWPQHVESTSESQTVDDEPISTGSGVPEEERCEQLLCTSSPVSAPGDAFLFDLNCSPDYNV